MIQVRTELATPTEDCLGAAFDDPAKRYCRHCGRELEESTHGLRRYCSPLCYKCAAEARTRQGRGIDPASPKRSYAPIHARSADGVVSFVEIGRALGVSYETARKIYSGAIAKLKSQPEAMSQLLATAAHLDAARAKRLHEMAVPVRNI